MNKGINQRGVIQEWKLLAQSASVGMTATETHAFKPAFEGQAFKEAKAWLGRG